MSKANLVAVVSGKGVVGKSNIAVNLAVAAGRRGRRVLLVDGDLGLSNVDVLLGLVPHGTLADVLDGRACMEDVLVRGPRGIDVLPAASGRSELAALGAAGAQRLASGVVQLAESYELAIVDAAPGIGPLVVAFAAVSARRLLVATSEPTSLADAYALAKVLSRDTGVRRIEVLVNAARHEREARDTRERLERMAARFLDLDLAPFGWLPHDPRLAAAVKLQRPVVDAFPASAVARRLDALADALLAPSHAHAAIGSASEAVA
jgi:flagellar biosynthesis protein FlhG